ncbi:GGDEF domain-containing protein [Pseudomonas sp. nanlin1]|uniref:GGDEF domain-containing protein n=1 Tax=Pseudomonas sp. nanlin1 TaxID=3040605 RepID=UPI00388F6E8B
MAIKTAGPLRPRPRWRERSLGRRLVLATLVFSLLFTLVGAAARTWFAWQSNLTTMNTELGLIDQVFQYTLGKAVWEVDRESLLTQLDNVAQAAPVGRVELRIINEGRKPEILERVRSDFNTSRYAPVLQRNLVVHPYPGSIETVGSLLIEGDENILWQRLWQDVASIIITQVAQSLALAGMIMAMFNRTVTVHVQHIAEHLSQLSPRSLRRRLLLDRSRKTNDELALLESGVNALQDKLVTYLDGQREAERALAASRDHLADLVQARTAELQAANQRLERLSRHDPLTGLANRRHFDELKNIEFERARRQQQPLAVLMCDVDYFKRYNDSHGHAGGDECLRQIAETLKGTFNRSGELIARLGGEEFAVLLPGADLSGALQAAERLRTALDQRQLPHGASPVSPWITVSIGVAQLEEAHMTHFDSLLQRADQALYRAKQQGRDRVAQ